jgi:DNA-binding CsgD family transcriptional regulator
MMHFAAGGDGRLDVATGSAISVHVSARIAALRALESFASTWDGALTAREQEVATLAARGLTTRDMGKAAGISPNTVKKHLKQLYAKLGVTSRAELSSVLLRGPHGGAEEAAGRARGMRRTTVTGIPAYFY